MIPARAALERLREGNLRYVAGSNVRISRIDPQDRTEIAKDHRPFAIILGCSDARVPAEMVFDQGLGDLFVIRVAGNVVAPSQIGSVEFAAARLGARLVVVLGHSECGAVLATLEELRAPSANRSPNLASIVDRIRPAVEGLLADGGNRDGEELVESAVRANVQASVAALRHGSDILEGLIDNEGVRIVGAEYALETGVVHFLDGADEL